MPNIPSSACLLLYDTGDIIPFQYAPVSGFKTATTANYETIQVITRQLPIIHTKGLNEQLSLTLDFVCEDDDRFDVVSKINLLKSVCMATNGLGTDVSRIVINWGALFPKNNFYILSSMTPNYELFDLRHDLMPVQAQVECVFVLQSQIPVNRDYFLFKR